MLTSKKRRILHHQTISSDTSDLDSVNEEYSSSPLMEIDTILDSILFTLSNKKSNKTFTPKEILRVMISFELVWTEICVILPQVFLHSCLTTPTLLRCFPSFIRNFLFLTAVHFFSSLVRISKGNFKMLRIYQLFQFIWGFENHLSIDSHISTMG